METITGAVPAPLPKPTRNTGSLQIRIGQPIPQEYPSSNPPPVEQPGPAVAAFDAADQAGASIPEIEVVADGLLVEDRSGLNIMPEPPAPEPDPLATLKDEVKPTFVPVAPLITPISADINCAPQSMTKAYKAFAVALGMLGALVLVFAVSLRMAQPSVQAPVAKIEAPAPKTATAPVVAKQPAPAPAPAPVAAPAPKAVVDNHELIAELKAAKAQLKSDNDYLSRAVVREEAGEEPSDPAYVKSAQTALNVVMGSDITVDGKFGPATAELNGRFHDLVGGLPAREGRNVIGQATLRALIEALADTSPQGMEVLKQHQAGLEESYDSEGTGVQSASSGSTTGYNGLVVEDKPTAPAARLTDSDLDKLSQINSAPKATAHKPTASERASAGYDAVVNTSAANTSSTPSAKDLDRLENERPPVR